MTRAGATRRRGRAKGPSLWTLAAALVVIALASYAGANRVGGEVGRLERAERLSYLLQARAYEHAALHFRVTSTGAADEATAPAGRRRPPGADRRPGRAGRPPPRPTTAGRPAPPRAGPRPGR